MVLCISSSTRTSTIAMATMIGNAGATVATKLKRQNNNCKDTGTTVVIISIIIFFSLFSTPAFCFIPMLRHSPDHRPPPLIERDLCQCCLPWSSVRMRGVLHSPVSKNAQPHNLTHRSALLATSEHNCHLVPQVQKGVGLQQKIKQKKGILAYRSFQIL